MESKSVDATGMNLGRNVISFLNLEQYRANHNTIKK